MQVIKPRSEEQKVKYRQKIFLAGTIEMGKSIDWQAKVQDKLSDLPITIFNPRRDNWDSDLTQRKSNPEFNYQVNWEIDNLEASQTIFFSFLENTISPISFYEFGKFSEKGKKIIVYCPEEFYRFGNIEIYSDRDNIELHTNFDSAVESLKSYLKLKML